MQPVLKSKYISGRRRHIHVLKCTGTLQLKIGDTHLTSTLPVQSSSSGPCQMKSSDLSRPPLGANPSYFFRAHQVVLSATPTTTHPAKEAEEAKEKTRPRVRRNPS